MAVAYLVLDDGRIFEGTSWAATGKTFGEAVFQTGMTGYQETLTDPSIESFIIKELSLFDLKIGIKSNYEKWLHSILDEPGVSTITPSFWVRHMHAEVLAKWVKHFGKENVVVIVVDEKQPEFMYQEFNNLLSLKPGLLKPQIDQDSNRSLTLD